MELTTLRAFVKEASSLYSGGPPDYLPVHVVMEKLYPGLKKTSASGSALSHAVELGGLGMLAKPSVDTLRGKHSSEKSKAKWEVAGLGTLAAPYVLDFAKAGIKKLVKK